MDDTVKLIIEIPKEDYEFTKGAETARVFPSEYYVELILNGTPLDDVKAEIDTAQEPYKTITAYDEGVRFGLMLAYQIIDKYKAESEVKPNE